MSLCWQCPPPWSEKSFVNKVSNFCLLELYKVTTVVMVKWDWNKLTSKKPHQLLHLFHASLGKWEKKTNGKSPPVYGFSTRFKLGAHLGTGLFFQTSDISSCFFLRPNNIWCFSKCSGHSKIGSYWSWQFFFLKLV